ncbi:Hypothetical protein ACI5QL_02874 [Bacillus velezensis]
MFDEMEEDQEVLMYYSLLEERHKMEIKKTDHMIEYYFFLFEALYESHKRNFETFINNR